MRIVAIPTWIYESPGDRFQHQVRQMQADEEEATHMEEEAYRKHLLDDLVPTISSGSSRHSRD
jgi:hypothetical protein